MQANASRTLQPKAASTATVLFLFWSCWALLTSGCNLGASGDYVKNISSVKPDVATEAMSQAASNKSSRAIVPLVKRLHSEDPVIRLSAIRALKDITGQDLGYRSYEPQVKRVEAIERWQAWLVEQNLVVTQEQDEPSD
jgi:hypothetical protein